MSIEVVVSYAWNGDIRWASVVTGRLTMAAVPVSPGGIHWHQCRVQAGQFLGLWLAGWVASSGIGGLGE